MAEYKLVTVLFADVVHSMDIAAAVGAERLREIMTDLVNRAAVVVQRFGGTVNQFTGDGVMAVFGAPVALEDHAVRACLAALGVQDEAKRLAEEVTSGPHGRAPGVETAMVPSRNCVKSSTTCSMPGSLVAGLLPTPCSWRRCLNVVGTVTWPKPRPLSSG